MLKKLASYLAIPVLLIAGEQGSSLSLHYEYFKDANEVWSHTPGFDVRAAFAPNWSATVSAEVDGVSGASRVNPPSAYSKDGVSGASRKQTPTLVDGISGASTVEFRWSQTSHVTYNHAGNIVSLGYYTSKEDDYYSAAPMLDLATDLFDRNTTLGVSLSYYDDRFVNQDVNPPEGSGRKRLTSGQFSITQSLTSLTLVSASVQRIHSWGYLSKPYNPVMVKLEQPIVEDVATNTIRYYDQFPEVLPDDKKALVFAGEIVQGYTFIPDLLGSIRVQYRYYSDDWKLTSHTIDNEWSQYLSESLYLRLRYRYYTQTRAEFVYQKYDGSEKYMTSDIKYYPFTSNLVGIKLGGLFPDDWQENHVWVPTSWNVKVDYLFRNTKGNTGLYQYYGLNQNYYQTTFMTGVDYAF